jgi:hypothetical protein
LLVRERPAPAQECRIEHDRVELRASQARWRRLPECLQFILVPRRIFEQAKGMVEGRSSCLGQIPIVMKDQDLQPPP